MHLGTTLLDHERYPADELAELYRQWWEIELAFDEDADRLCPVPAAVRYRDLIAAFPHW